LKQFFKLVESGEITKVIITYRDRLTRFGFKYLEQYFNSHGVELKLSSMMRGLQSKKALKTIHQ